MTTSPSLDASPVTDGARPPRDLRSFWRHLLAVVAPLGPVSLGASQYLEPLDAEASLLLNLVAAMLLMPGVMALAWVTRRAAPGLSASGGLLAFVGYAAMFQAPNLTALAVAARGAGLGSPQSTELLVAVRESPLFFVPMAVFLLAHVVGLVLIAIALRRSRLVPTWMALALGAGACLDPLLAVATGSTAIGALGYVVLAAGFAAASVALLRTSDARFDLPPGDEPGSHASAAGALDLRRSWRILLGTTAGVAPLVVAVLRFLMPYDTLDDPATAASKSIAAPEFSLLAGSLGFATAICLVPGLLVVAWISRRRAPVLTTVAVVTAYVGFVQLSIAGFPGDAVIVAGTRMGMPDDRLADLLVSGQSSGTVAISGVAFVIFHIVGAVLLGSAVLRSRSLPAVIGWLLVVSQPLHFVAAVILSNRLVDLVAWGATAVAFAAAGVRLIRTPDDRFDLAPQPVSS
jgi:hypothetical protein